LASESITVRTYLVTKWMPAIKSTVRTSTFYGYDIHVRLHISPRIGRLRLSHVTGERLNALYAELATSGSAKGEGPLAPATVRRVHVTLHRAFKDAVRWGYLSSNPCEAADPPKLNANLRPEMRTWTAVELATFLTVTKHDPLYPLFRLIAMTGLRRGEALGLRWGDVNLERGELAVRQTIIQLKDGLHRSSPKTARSARVVALDERTTSILKTFRPESADPTALVFCGDNGSPLNPTAVTRRFIALGVEAGLPRIRLHDLRHTHATLALQADVHPKIVSERLGHSTIAFTLDVYSHAIPHMQTEAAAQIANLVAGAKASAVTFRSR
jgi:integrase